MVFDDIQTVWQSFDLFDALRNGLFAATQHIGNIGNTTVTEF